MQFTQIYRNIPRNILPFGFLFYPKTPQGAIISGLARIVLILLILGASIAFAVNGPKPAPRALSLSKMVEKVPQDVNLRLQYVGELENKNQIEEARKQLLTVLNFDPTNAYALSFYGALGAKSSNLGEEIAKLREILAVRPDYQKAWAELATLYEYQGETNLANDARQKASELAKKL
ncbi:MAG: hypothetical protein Q7S45_02675 [Candidatus Curtissbacteria bacterium]|nr:hypothetical protein [Candidatus Curtissbacteria bacterium]